jgi:hypothetical protein
MDSRCEVYIGYHSMQLALIGNVVVEIVGGFLFFLAAIFVIRDRLRVHDYLTSEFSHLKKYFGHLFQSN